jgi:hypothetical protein
MKNTILALALVAGFIAFTARTYAQNLPSDLTDGLLNYYTFQGNANDSIGGNNISLTGNVSLNDGFLYINSNIGEYPPDHSTQPFSSSNINITGNTSQSLSFWVKSSNITTLFAGVGFGYQPPSGGITELNIYPNSLWLHGYNYDSPFITISQPNADAWHMISFTYNTSQSFNSSLFYDGQSIWNGNINLATAPGALYVYGNAGASVTDIGIWNKALSSNQVSELYTQQAQSVPEPSTYALFGIGALALVVAYRRRNGCVATAGPSKVAFNNHL